MTNSRKKFFTRFGMLALIAFLALPLTAFAQDNGRARDAEADGNAQQRRRDRSRDDDQARQQAQARDAELRRQAEQNRAAELRRQQEQQRADELRRQQEQNRNEDWRRNQGNNNDNNGRGRDWDRYGRYGGSFQLRQTALNAGYNSGIKEGRKDRSHGDRFDYRDEGDYQKATKDYSSRLGDRELYRRYFREGFATGYQDGYRGY